jgi:predicted dehydrogenase
MVKKVDLQVGIVGLGKMGRNHLRTLNQIEEVNVVGIVDTRGHEYKESNLANFVDLNRLIEIKPDYCVVSTPTASHFDIASKLLGASIPVMIEKPVCTDLLELSELKKISTQNNVPVTVGQVERFNPAVLLAKKYIEDGSLGEVMQFETIRIGGRPERITDVGVILDLASHDIDIGPWLFSSDYTSLHCEMIVEGDTETSAVSVGRLENGIITSHSVNWISPEKKRQMTCRGTQKTIVIDTLEMSVRIQSASSKKIHFESVRLTQGTSSTETFIPPIEKSEPLLLQHLEFIKYLCYGTGQIVTLEEAGRTLKNLELMRFGQ